MNPSTFKLVADLMELEEHFRIMSPDDLRMKELRNQIDMLYELIEQKFDSAVYVIQTMESQIEIFKNVKRQADARIRTTNSSIERIKYNFMKLAELRPEVLKGDLYKGSISSRVSVKEVDEDKVPAIYTIKVPETFKVDGRKLNSVAVKAKQDLGRFPKIPGVKFQIKEHLSFRQAKDKGDDSSNN